MKPQLVDFIRGVLFASYAVAGLFFCRFWRRTRESLFAWFAAAFWLMAVERLIMFFANTSEDQYALVHLIRLSAFLMIIVAIANKNRTRRPRSDGPR